MFCSFFTMNMSDLQSMGWKITGFGVLPRNCYSCVTQSSFFLNFSKIRSALILYNNWYREWKWSCSSYTFLHNIKVQIFQACDLTDQVWTKTIFHSHNYVAKFECRKLQYTQVFKIWLQIPKKKKNKNVQSTCMSKLINNFQQQNEKMLSQYHENFPLDVNGG